MIKSFHQKIEQPLNEASLKGNPGIPGEGGTKGSYLTDVESEMRRKNEEFQRRFGREIPNFMGFVREARSLQKGHEEKLEALAEKAIRIFYGEILGETKLNIKFPRKYEIKKMMEKAPKEPPEMPQSLKILQDEDIISKIHARKIQNNITQGEAKNVKLILNLPEVSEGIAFILGKDGKRYIELLNKITEIANFFDWTIPPDVQLEMWTRDKSGFAGAVQTTWAQPEEKSDEDLAQEILDSLMDDEDLPQEEAEKLFDSIQPTINAVGTDFAMLIHETVKGIYELIASAAIPDDPNEAEDVLINTDTLADELEDLRYGPEITADLRDFLNQFPEIDSIPNFREKVYGKMVLISKEEPKKFLNMILNILQDDPIAKQKIKVLVDEVKEEWDEYQKAKTEYDLENDKDQEEVEDESNKEINYGSLSKKEIQKLIDQAIDDKDFEKVKELSFYLKESAQLKLYEKVMKVHGYKG
jgi:hypothetical protein